MSVPLAHAMNPDAGPSTEQCSATGVNAIVCLDASGHKHVYSTIDLQQSQTPSFASVRVTPLPPRLELHLTDPDLYTIVAALSLLGALGAARVTMPRVTLPIRKTELTLRLAS